MIIREERNKWNNNLHHRCLLLRSPVRVNATGDAGYYFYFTTYRKFG